MAYSRHTTTSLSHLQATNNTTKNYMLSVTLRRRLECEKELRCIGILSTVSHGQQPLAIVFQHLSCSFVLEFLSKNRLPATAVAKHKVTSLHNESRDHPMNDGIFIH